MKSLGLHLFYLVKPVVPRRVQIFLRRLQAGIRRRTSSKVWPIDTASGKPPSNWKGWPEGKKFAFILTHDVETARGQERCRDLAKMEQDLGFKSSYNFVPERYTVSENLRNHLTDNGFEVGVHGLNHDGKYLISRNIFRERAERINRYLEEWKSVGFRMPSMLHNLSWIHDLNILYDSSTFDTDPFEPQPDGVGTIFPFWVSPDDRSQRGYVELPYTLPQDFTLIIILREKDTRIWKEKLDWIASHGGMAMLNAHPDYMNFDGSTETREEYPVSLYTDFLSYVRANYEHQYWNALPREIARYYREYEERKRPAI